MIHFRVQMIGPPGQNDAMAAGLLQPLHRLPTLPADILPEVHQRGPSGCHSQIGFCHRDPKGFLHKPAQPFSQGLFISECQEGIQIPNILFLQILQIVPDVFRIGNHHRTVVMVLSRRILLLLIEDAGIKDRSDPLIHQPPDMSMDQLRRVTLRLTGDAVHPQAVNRGIRERRQHDPKPQFSEEHRPEGIILVHIQDPGDADGAPSGFFL